MPRHLCLLPLLLAATVASGASQNSYILGNSYSAQVRWNSTGYPSLVASAGHTVNARELTVPGIPLNGLWQNNASDYAPDFRSTVWDNVSFQAWAGYDTELQAARNFCEAIWGLGPVGPDAQPGEPLGISPDASIYIYAHGRDKKISFDDGGFLVDRLDYEGLDMATLDYFEDMCLQLRSEYPGKPVYVLPAAVVLYEVDKYMEAGLIPGFDDYDDLLRDGGHTNDLGSHLLALSFFATFWGEDPSGLPVPAAYTTDEATNAIFQEITWRVVSRYPLSGVPTGLVVTNFHLPRGLEGEPLHAQFEAWGASGATTWSLAEGRLPNGLSLTPDGTLSGTPTENGHFLFSVTATDAANATDTRQMLLFVDPNNPPVIETTVLPNATIGSPYRLTLQASGGVPGYTWSVKDNLLPHGLSVSPSGELTGTAYGEPGLYEVTLVATDSNPNAPVSVEQTYGLTLLPASNGTWMLSLQPDPGVSVDGHLDEPAWSLPGSANHPLIGTPDNITALGLLPTVTGLYIGIDVTDAQLIADSSDIAEDDTVQLFLDALHDREATFNADDRHILVRYDGTFEERNSRPTGILSAATTTSGGYSVELLVPWSNLGLTPADYFSIGFDLGISDDDTGGLRDAYTAWLSATDADTSPAQFGSVCFWPVIDNAFLNPGFEEASLFNTKSYAERFIDTSDAGQGWRVTSAWLASFMQTDAAAGDGFPGTGSKAFGTNSSIDGNLLQLIADGKQTQGRGYLIFDVREPDPALQYFLWGYNGGAATVDGKLAAAVRGQPIDPGSPDGVLLAGSLPATASGWVRTAVEFDAGSGYDYLLLAFSLPRLTGSPFVRIDNISAGPVASTGLRYNPPQAAETVSLAVLTATATEGSGTLLQTRFERTDPASPFALGATYQLSGTADASDFAGGLPYAIIPARTTSHLLALLPADDALPEGLESATVTLQPSPRVDLGQPHTVSLTLRDHPLDQYQFDQFGGSATESDGDRDGAHWMLEYFTGTSDTDPTDAQLPMIFSDAGEPRFELTYDPAADGVTPAISLSTDLVDWTTFPLSSAQIERLSEVTHSDGTVTEVYRLPILDASALVTFGRLGLERR